MSLDICIEIKNKIFLKTEQNFQIWKKTLQVDTFVLKLGTKLSYKRNKTLKFGTKLYEFRHL